MNIPKIDLKKMLSEYDLRPTKGLGQNFLTDENALLKIVLAADISDESEILEIGPGLGHLTRYLATSSKIVHAVEIDKKMIPALEIVLKDYSNVNIINADIMEFELSKLGLTDGYLVVANIPYYITSAIIKLLLQFEVKPKRLVLTTSSKIVHAVEIDKKMIPALEIVLKDYSNVNIINADIMEFELSKLGLTDGYLVVANIPYYITSAIIKLLLQFEVKPKRLVLTMQKEVANRICAKQGEHSLLSLSVQVYGKPRISSVIKANSFYPAPKVDSAVLRVDIHDEPLVDVENIPLFFRLIKAGFSQKRKMLRNTISAGMHWEKEESSELLIKAEIDPMARAQTLSIEDWNRLVEVVSNK